MTWDNWIVSFVNVVEILTLLVYVSAPMAMTLFFRSRIRKFKKPYFKKRFGDLIEGLSRERKSSANLFAIFCYRRLFSCFFIVLLESKPYFQIMCTVLVNQFVVILIGASRPFTEDRALKVEFFNESMVMLSAYFLFVYSDFVDSPQARYYTGYALISLASFTIVVNVLLMISSTLSGIAKIKKL
jgi:hypothetical protein